MLVEDRRGMRFRITNILLHLRGRKHGIIRETITRRAVGAFFFTAERAVAAPEEFSILISPVDIGGFECIGIGSIGYRRLMGSPFAGSAVKTFSLSIAGESVAAECVYSFFGWSGGRGCGEDKGGEGDKGAEEGVHGGLNLGECIVCGRELWGWSDVGTASEGKSIRSTLILFLWTSETRRNETVYAHETIYP